ncbi:hypothetical protein F4808DRAFT_475765 [Astrocystis sublimbata]|nr:hypothetical protein F4808DRAFT_475765 [Astrocystis sublimbata]
MEFQRSPAPSKSQTPLRWFSRQSTSSSGTTRHKRSSQSCGSSTDMSSIERLPSISFLDKALTPECWESRSSAQMEASLSSMYSSADYSEDCHVLVPRITITPEAAIEVSVQLSQPSSSIDTPLDAEHDNSSFVVNPLRVGSAYRFGYLYNIHVDVSPAPDTTVIEVIEDHRTQILSLGSTTLVLTKLEVERRQPQPASKAMLRSSELIAELECELGLAYSELFQVSLTYRHSGFPTSNNVTTADGTTNCQTQLKTTATSVIDKRALDLPLDPSRMLAENSIFDIAASYWGPIRANEVLCKTQPSFLDQEEEDDDPARKIWAGMRRRASGSRQDMRTVNAGHTPLRTMPGRGTLPSAGSVRMKTDIDRRRDQIRDVALRNKRSIGADSLKSLVPSMMNLDLNSKETWGDTSSNDSENKENMPPGHEKEGRWSVARWGE